MRNGLVSVIIPAYNSAGFIKKTINSVLKQSYENFEVVVLDDGSSDHTASIVKNMALSDKRIRYFFQQNQGLAASRNKLCELAAGEFIAFLDHDDEWLPQKLKIQMPLFVNRDCALVYGNVLGVYADQNEKNLEYFKTRRPHRGRVFYNYLLEGNFTPQPSLVVRSEILRRYLPFKSNFKIALDWELLLRLSREHLFDYVDETVAVYNLHGNRTTAKNVILEIDEILEIMEFWHKNDPLFRSLHLNDFLRAKAKVNMQKAYFYQGRGDLKNELAEITRCMGIDPTWMKPYAKLVLSPLLTVSNIWRTKPNIG